MGLGFLAPLFLAGLAALAIPVLVHLTHRERKEPVVFPSLMFLHRIPFRTQRRQRIRHWLLFLLRGAAVALLVAAFARPFIRRQVAEGAGSSDLVLLIDRSASMGARGRWERAVAAARAAVQRAGARSRVAVVAFDDRAEALTELTNDRAAALAALAQARPGSAAGRYAPALQSAAALLERANSGGEVVLVSDFQRAGWDGQTAVRLPAGVSLRTVDVGDTSLVNTAITSVVLERQGGAEPRTVVTARLAGAHGGAREVPVAFALDGRVVQTVTVRVAPGASAVARFAALRDPEGIRRARVTLPADDQPADDTWSFVLGPAPRLGVLILSRGDAPAGDLLYLREALDVARDPSFPVTQRIASSVRAADLAAAAVVIVHDAPFPGGEPGRRLLDYLRAGGGMLVALGARGTLPSALADSLGTGAGVVDRGDLGAALAVTDAAHPVFAWGERADLGGSRAFRYRRLERARTALARYDDGVPALAETRLGAGHVLVWTADLANRWSDAPLHPAFVPLVHGAIRYLARFTPPPAARMVGDVVELDGEWERGRVGALESGTVIVEHPDGTREALPAGGSRLRLGERGFFGVHGNGTRSAALLLAANVPPSESDPARIVPEQLVAAVAPDSSAVAPARAGMEGPAERERDQRLWWYLLGAVLLLLAAESAVAHRARGIR